MSEEFFLTTEASDCMARLYPRLDFSKLHFYHGLPWFLITQPWVSGITLPHSFKPGHISIYFKRIDFTSLEGLCLLVHECYHALQIQEIGKPLGPGFFSKFLAEYLASWSKFGYRNHPLEIPAYSFESTFHTYAEEAVRPDWFDSKSPIMLSDGFPTCKEIQIAYTAERWRLVVSWLLVGLIALIKPILDFLTYLPYKLFLKRRR